MYRINLGGIYILLDKLENFYNLMEIIDFVDF